MIRMTIVLSTLLVGACFPADKQVEAATGYEAQQTRCVEQYADRKSIDACRARVKAAWAPRDAGADADAQDGAK